MIASATAALALGAGTPVTGARAQATRERIPAGRPIGVLIIPRLGEQLVVRQGVAASVLQYGPGHYPQTSLPGQAGTIAIAGHRVTHTRPFLHLNLLRRGDPITFVARDRRFRYRVYAMKIVSPASLWVLMRHSRTPRLVLTTCHPPRLATYRLVVFARQMGR